VYEDQIQLKKGYEEEQHVLAKVEEQNNLAKMKKQVEQHSEDVRKRVKKVSHELKTKGNKVLALRTLGEGYDQEHKNKKKVESREKKERVRKEECVEKVGKHLNCFCKI
jgi:histidinol dehydrogenase